MDTEKIKKLENHEYKGSSLKITDPFANKHKKQKKKQQMQPENDIKPDNCVVYSEVNPPPLAFEATTIQQSILSTFRSRRL